MEKKTILMLTPVFEQGGTEVYILNLAKYLKDIYNVLIISGGGVRENEPSEIGIEHHIIPQLREQSFINLFTSCYKLRKFIVNNNIDIIHTSSIYTTIVAKLSTIFLKRIFVVYTMHGGLNPNIELTNKHILNIFPDKVITLSNKTKTQLINNGVQENKLKTIYNGIEFKKVYKKAHLDKVIITTCGRLTEAKGQKYLIEAASIMKNKNFEIWIIGDGELKKELMDYTEKLNITQKIKFLGFRRNVLTYLEETDIFILPSIWEQFPISILEAMMVGLPIIASNINGIPEQLGECGILTKPRDVKDIVIALEYLLDNNIERERLGRLAKKRFIDKYTVEKMSEDTITIYEDLFVDTN